MKISSKAAPSRTFAPLLSFAIPVLALMYLEVGHHLQIYTIAKDSIQDVVVGIIDLVLLIAMVFLEMKDPWDSCFVLTFSIIAFYVVVSQALTKRWEGAPIVRRLGVPLEQAYEEAKIKMIMGLLYLPCILLVLGFKGERVSLPHGTSTAAFVAVCVTCLTLLASVTTLSMNDINAAASRSRTPPPVSATHDTLWTHIIPGGILIYLEVGHQIGLHIAVNSCFWLMIAFLRGLGDPWTSCFLLTGWTIILLIKALTTIKYR